MTPCVLCRAHILAVFRGTGLLLLMLVAVVSLACASELEEDVPVSGGVSSAAGAPRSGKDIFAATCVTCHGAEGEGQPAWRIARADGTRPAPPLNGDGHTWHHADDLLYVIVSRGGKTQESPLFPSFKSTMPAFGDQYSHEEIVAVLTYVKSLWAGKTVQGASFIELQAEKSETNPFPPPP